MWPSAAEFTRPRGGLYPASQPQHRKEEGEGDRLPLVLSFFHRIFDPCRSRISFSTFFQHLHIMVVIVRVGFGGHSLQVIS